MLTFFSSAENRKCSYLSRLGNLYQASSGSNFVDYRKCALCLCAAGEAAFCVSQRRDVCDIINPAPQADRSCLIRGRRVQDGESISVSQNTGEMILYFIVHNMS